MTIIKEHRPPETTRAAAAAAAAAAACVGDVSELPWEAKETVATTFFEAPAVLQELGKYTWQYALNPMTNAMT